MTGDWFTGYVRDAGHGRDRTKGPYLTANKLPIHKHTCDKCGDFGCTRPTCLLGSVVTHRGHEREITRRKARGFDGPEGQPAA